MSVFLYFCFHRAPALLARPRSQVKYSSVLFWATIVLGLKWNAIGEGFAAIIIVERKRKEKLK